MRSLTMVLLGWSILCFAGSGNAQDKDPAKKKGPPPEILKVLGESPQDFLKRYDKNGDGVVTKDELPTILAERVFDKTDRDGDAKLDKTEIRDLFQVLQRTLPMDPSKTGAPNPERIVADMLERMDVNKDGKIGRGEAKGPLAENFDRLDANKDGSLDKSELQQAARRAGGMPPGNRPEVDRMMANLLQRFDTNKDGKLSKDEAQGPLSQTFERADANKDGYLDKDELRRVAERMAMQAGGMPPRPGGPGFGGASQGPDFDALDKDADGRVTKDELKGNPLAEKFDAIDANKDGKIDKKEFEASLKKPAEKK